MTLLKKILGVGWLFCSIPLLPGGPSLAAQENQNRQQAQQQSPSTVELEAQPNTYQYPRVRRRGGIPQPNTPAGDPDSQPNSVQPNNNIQPNNVPSVNPNFRPQPALPAPAPAAAPVTSVRPPGSAPAPAQVVPQTQGFIGPPAPIPPTPEQMAPAAPKVMYQNGLLSVESVNARLIDILNGIHAKAGIQFEGMQGAQERVAGKFGPAPADAVLSSLLRGSRYDYVIIGMPANPALVQRVILTPTSGTAAVTGTPGAQPAVAQQSDGDEEDNSGDDTAAAVPVPQGQAPQQGLAQPLGANTPKSTEQLLEELKQMQQQNQQNQQNQQRAPLKPTGPQ